MALIKCYECGQMISDKASVCPKCGAAIHGNIGNDSTVMGDVQDNGQTRYAKQPNSPVYPQRPVQPAQRPVAPAPQPSTNKLLVYGLVGLIALLTAGILYVVLKDDGSSKSGTSQIVDGDEGKSEEELRTEKEKLER